MDAAGRESTATRSWAGTRAGRIVWGAGAAALYITAALWAERGAIPLRILYDGFAPPPPYRWVRPPARLAAENQPPEAGSGSISLSAGSEYASVGTGDGQAFVIFPPDAIAPSGNESAAGIALVPLDPATIGPPPEGTRVDGNAYRIAARYTTSQQPVVLRKPVTVVLRYPTSGTGVLRSTDSWWTLLRSTNIHMALQTVAETDRLGIFAAAAPVGVGPLAFLVGLPRALMAVLSAALGLIFLIVVRSVVRRRPRPSVPDGAGQV
jgi:hypothetical protein